MGDNIIDSLNIIKQITETKVRFKLELFKHIDDWVHLAFFVSVVVILIKIVRYLLEQAETNQSKKDQEKEITHRETELSKLKIKQIVINKYLETQTPKDNTSLKQLIDDCIK